jgi:tRNA modification GTPase
MGGIGIVRLSGPQSINIAPVLFRKPDGTMLARWPARRLVHGYIIDPTTQERADEVLMVVMPAPRTYTREDVAEIHCHGGPVAVQRVLELVITQGARLANPGEFTLRAFLNGRLDLTQAEAVMDIVSARTRPGLRLAESQLSGSLSEAVRQVRRPLVSLLAHLTALVDFPDEDIPSQEWLENLDQAAGRIGSLLANADQGIIYRQGVRVAIVGRPNVGKSSLLNALLRQNRSIVTPVPGTTRDTVEETVNLRGIPFVLIDTAGITVSDDPVEREGIERSRRALAMAGLTLFVVDASQPVQSDDWDVAKLIDGKALLVANKIDLPGACSDGEMATLLPGAPVVAISALTGFGLPNLEIEMAQLALKGQEPEFSVLLVTNPRHKAALSRAASALAEARTILLGISTFVLASLWLTDALNALGEITGETVSEELLDAIFSQFCVGK